MVQTVNSDNFPWSIKGISIEARKLAKEGAVAEGITIGEWIKKVVESQEDTANVTLNSPIHRGKTEYENNQTVAPIDHSHVEPLLVDEMSKEQVLASFSRTEAKFLNLIKPLNSILQQLSLRMESLENKLTDERL